ncbi:hypothetical protein RR48_12230 [Papilio machaon]|uniref:Cyclin-dependent kinase 2-interacting protein n=1 Tax=Papilio machaon TaxID=76193 RepID=A0A194QSL4_PAPMA|nr:uncharacterized protein LOC106717880 [Papilio machaon]KPJ08477.1 hypothetical protein RR48_12230 [Papilio machaon]
MSKTPTKNSESVFFGPKELLTPNKDPTGIVKTVFTQISNIHRLLNQWFRVIEKGTEFVRLICALKLHEYRADYYPQQLKRLMEDLLEAKNVLKDIVESVDIINKQVQVLPKLHSTGLPVMNTWLAPHFASQVLTMYTSLCKEFKLKEVVTENIAHCRDEKLIEVYASAWEYTMYINMESVAYMFAEIGLSSIKKDVK